MEHPLDIVFGTDLHLRLLQRYDRGQAVRRAVEAATKQGDKVFDAGTGSGLLALLALKAGASNAVGVDRAHIALAKELALENGLADKIRFYESDLDTFHLEGSEKYDLLFLFIYTNHIIMDEHRSRLCFDLIRRFGEPGCTTVPGRLEYYATPCFYPSKDWATEEADIRQFTREMSSFYGLSFAALRDAALKELPLNRCRPTYHGAFSWLPASGNSSARFDRQDLVLLGDPQFFTAVDYTKPEPHEIYPQQMEIEVSSPGVLNGIIWTQQLWFRDQLIWTTEVISPLKKSRMIDQSTSVKLNLDGDWKRTNLLTC
ncbi:50S ribosomal protein L11 methyltransferase [Roseomonas mucosa]|uniref:50S ribosomal protein L11 methyltransferase n=1 Tax=Roseomonas mucosa TaxID=207340 RepID=UPI0028CCC07E|nr:50S ribosomal protein L11 methyltransferase [Roseomonas mucosa]MDT8277827.1 50S ribosomal protein L11 methyltransferase [Roseomonas mucosa]QDD96887.1 hypothetical protein ADP8_05173 [Roseomonas mucosa]